MSYVGSLKTWLYAPVLWLWPPSPASLRVPALFMGAATILLFGWFLERVHSRRAAWIGCVLLATDSVFLLTTIFDWGPVALQHLLTTSAMLFAVLWFQKHSDWWLAAAAFCCGLALWDKAVFVWMFVGLLAGSLFFVPKLRGRVTLRSAAFAIGPLVAGALPLLIYNLNTSSPFATIRSRPPSDAATLQQKLEIMRVTWNGSGLFGYMLYDSAEQPASPRSLVEKAAFLAHHATGDRRTNASEVAFLLSILLLPLLWRTPARNTLLFSLSALACAWTFMLISGGGGSAHHAILLWPLPQLFLAVTFAEASLIIPFCRWAVAILLCLLTVANLEVTNQYLFQFARNGAAGSWTDAIYPLTESFHNTPATQIVVADWGAEAPLCVLNRNRPPVRIVADSFLAPTETSAGRQTDLQLLADPQAIWVEHAPGHEISKGVNRRLLNSARSAGFDPLLLNTFYDRHGRAVFQIYRFHPVTFEP